MHYISVTEKGSVRFFDNTGRDFPVILHNKLEKINVMEKCRMILSNSETVS